MLPSIIERLAIQGDAQIIQQTIGLNGANTIEVPNGKTVIILKVNLQPLLSLADITAEWSAAVFIDWKDYVKRALVQTFDPDGKPNGTDLDILQLILSRGLTQIELYSLDNRTVFTYTNEYQPVPISITGPCQVGYLPNIKEHKEECYSIHKKQVHVRLRFANSFLFNDGQFTALTDSYKKKVDNGNLYNTVPEQNNNVMDLYKQYLFMSSAIFTSSSTSGKYGIFPFANETNLEGSENLGEYINNKFVLLPYDNQITPKPNGTNGELGYFVGSPTFGGVTQIRTFQQLFTPYINIQYALINEQPQSLSIVSPEKYATVITAK